MFTTESIRELRSGHEGTLTRARIAAICVSASLVLVPLALVVLAGYSASRASSPTDQELTARFVAHESDFRALLQMVEGERGKLPLGDEVVDLDALAAAGTDAARLAAYDSLLRKMGATNFQYLPRSGNLTVPIDLSPGARTESGRSYLYRRDAAEQPLIYHRGYAWRGPGAYVVTGDQHIKGHWFIHHSGDAVLVFAPY